MFRCLQSRCVEVLCGVKQIEMAGHMLNIKNVFILVVISLLVGALIGVEPTIGIKFFAIIFMVLIVANAHLLAADNNEWYTAKPILLLSVLLLYSSILWPKYGVIKFGGMPSVSPSKILYAAIFLVFIFSLFFDKGMKQRIIKDTRQLWPLYLGWGLYVTFKVVSVFVLDDAPIGFQLKYIVEQFLGYEFLFVIILSQIQTSFEVEKFIRIFMFCTLPLLAFALAEHVIGRTIFAYIVSVDYDESGRIAAGLLPKIRDGFHRLQASFEHPLVFGQYLSMSLPLLMYFFLKKNNKLISRVIALFSMLITILLIYATGLRSSLAISIITSVLMITFSPLLINRLKLDIPMLLRVIGISIFACVACYFLLLVIPEIITSKSAETASSSDARVYMFLHGLPYIISSPILGYGPGSAPFLAGVMVTGGFYSIDNFYLSLALDSGLVCLFGFTMTAGYAIWLLCRSFFMPINSDLRLMVICLSLSVVIYASTLVVLSISSNNYIYFILLALAGKSINLINSSANEC